MFGEYRQTVNHRAVCSECNLAVGNGPSGICLSYMLSGNWPYIRAAAHPDEMLKARLQDIDLTKSLLLQVGCYGYIMLLHRFVNCFIFQILLLNRFYFSFIC